MFRALSLSCPECVLFGRDGSVFPCETRQPLATLLRADVRHIFRAIRGRARCVSLRIAKAWEAVGPFAIMPFDLALSAKLAAPFGTRHVGRNVHHCDHQTASPDLTPLKNPIASSTSAISSSIAAVKVSVRMTASVRFS